MVIQKPNIAGIQMVQIGYQIVQILNSIQNEDEIVQFLNGAEYTSSCKMMSVFVPSIQKVSVFQHLRNSNVHTLLLIWLQQAQMGGTKSNLC